MPVMAVRRVCWSSETREDGVGVDTRRVAYIHMREWCHGMRLRIRSKERKRLAGDRKERRGYEYEEEEEDVDVNVDG